MGRSELGERDLACACCGVALESGFYSPPFLLPRPEEAQTRGLDCSSLKEEGHAAVNADLVFVSEQGPVIELFDEKPLLEDDIIAQVVEVTANAERLVPLESIFSKPLLEDDSVGIITQDAEVAANAERLAPLELIDSLAVSMAAMSSQSAAETKEVIDHDIVDAIVKNFVMNSGDDDKVDCVIHTQIATNLYAAPEEDNKLVDNDMEVSAGNDEICEQGEQAALRQDSYTVPTDPREDEFIEKLDQSIELDNSEEDELNHKLVKEADVPVSVTSAESFEGDHANEKVEADNTASQAGPEQEYDPVLIHSGEDVSVTSDGRIADEHDVGKQKSNSVAADVLDYIANTSDDDSNTGKEDTEGDLTEAAPPILQQISCGHLTILDKLSVDYSVMKEEGDPDTPTHIEGECVSQELLDSNAVISDTKSADSSVASVSSDLEITELVSIDQLKTALASARKSLNMLYAELENERNAAAIAADETMAMINRLQEQKAAMQMEAIQYRRLMEEQADYDQEALQRLNELVVKREKEKQDLERELELYRHKVHLYEAKMRKISRHKADDKNGSSSSSSSAEDSDDLSQSFYEGDESAHGLNGSNGSIPTDVVLQETARHLVTLDGSLTNFEEERLSILEQLKVLEDRLFDLDDDEYELTKTEKHLSEENHLNGESNGFSDDDSCFKLHGERKSVTCKGKKLLPLFDDATVEGGIVLAKQGHEVDHSTEITLELAREQDKLAIASEIDQVHERLHALEADRDFIKQCVRSLKRGGKGFDLVQEIVQHLRDLRRIEQRTRNSGELSPHYLHPYTD